MYAHRVDLAPRVGSFLFAKNDGANVPLGQDGSLDPPCSLAAKNKAFGLSALLDFCIYLGSEWRDLLVGRERSRLTDGRRNRLEQAWKLPRNVKGEAKRKR